MKEIDRTRDFSYMAGATDPMTKAQKHIIIGDRGKKRKNRKELYGGAVLRQYISEKYNIPFEDVDLQKLTKQQAQDIIVTFPPQPRNTKKSKQENENLEAKPTKIKLFQPKRCENCGKLITSEDELVELNVYSGDETEPFAKSTLCKECAEPLRKLSNEDFNKIISDHLNDLKENWISGNAENSKVGDIVRIISLKGEDNHEYLYKTGVIQSIDPIGQLHGSWGGLAIIPSVDTYLVFKGGEVTNEEKN